MILVRRRRRRPRRRRPPRPARGRPPGRSSTPTSPSSAGTSTSRGWPSSSHCSCCWSPSSSAWPSLSGWLSGIPGQIFHAVLAGVLGAAAAVLAGRSPSLPLLGLSAALLGWTRRRRRRPRPLAPTRSLVRRPRPGLALAVPRRRRPLDRPDPPPARNDRRPRRPDPGDLGQLPHRGIAARARPQPGTDRRLLQGSPGPRARPHALAEDARSRNRTGTRASRSATPKAARSAVSRSTSPGDLGRPPDLGPAEDWTIVPYPLTFIGMEKEFLIGYRDYSENGVPLGRVVLYVSIDPEMLPFLYSANPYFEVLRTDSLPSLGEVDFGCEIFDLDGRSLFNPRRLTAGLADADRERLAAGSAPVLVRVPGQGHGPRRLPLPLRRTLLQPLHAEKAPPDQGRRFPEVLLPRPGRGPARPARRHPRRPERPRSAIPSGPSPTASTRLSWP
ncbi:MAG: hypothetical protein M0C28_02375 [Candidatus Moduliflexus flocculans]|nr:hypothetical protein [Candidatus Moduliflexus flocculans]